MGVAWEPSGDLRSTKKFVFELLMASVDLAMSVFFVCLLLCSFFSSLGVVMLLTLQEFDFFGAIFLGFLAFRR